MDQSAGSGFGRIVAVPSPHESGLARLNRNLKIHPGLFLRSNER